MNLLVKLPEDKWVLRQFAVPAAPEIQTTGLERAYEVVSTGSTIYTRCGCVQV